MSRLDDAVDALRKAAGDRPFVLVIDACAPAAASYDLRVHGPTGTAPYVLVGLMEQAKSLLLAPRDEQVDVEPDSEVP